MGFLFSRLTQSLCLNDLLGTVLSTVEDLDLEDIFPSHQSIYTILEEIN